MKKVFLSFYFLCCGGTLVRLRVDISPLIGKILLSLLILYDVITIYSNFSEPNRQMWRVLWGMGTLSLP